MMKPIRFLAFGFFFLFMQFHAVERHLVASFGADERIALIGLTLGYFTLFIGDFVSPIVIARFGPRRTLMAASTLYMGWVTTVVLQVLWAYVAMSLVSGFAAALLWNSMASYAHRVTTPEELEQGVLDQRLGFILLQYGTGAALGLLTVSGLLVVGLTLHQSFFWLMIPAGLAVIAFSRLDKEVQIPSHTVAGIIAMYKNVTVLRLATVCVTAFVTFGLLVSIIPMQIEAVFGASSIGVYSSVAFFSLLLCSVFARRLMPLGRSRLIPAAYLVLTAGLLLLLLTRHAAWMGVGVIMVCVSFALLFQIMFGLSDCVPMHKTEPALAVFTSADDLAIFGTLAVGLALEAAGLSLEWLEWGALGWIYFSLILLLPLLLDGRDLDEAKLRLRMDFPTPNSKE